MVIMIVQLSLPFPCPSALACVFADTGSVDDSVTTVEFIYLYRSDWEKSVKDAQRRNAAG